MERSTQVGPDLPPEQRTALFRTLFGAKPSGVTVVTALSGGTLSGLTASAVCAVSLEPMLLLACLKNTSRTLAGLRLAGAFAVNLLAADQVELADLFAAPASPRVAAVPHRIEHGAPVLAEALGTATCRLEATYPGGDHTIVLGAVTGLRLRAGEPLIRYAGQYRRLASALLLAA